MKTIIYSKDNPANERRIADMKRRHPKFTFVELGDKDAVKEAKENPMTIVVEMDTEAPKAVNKPVKVKAEKSKPTIEDAKKAVKAQKKAATKKKKKK